MIPELSLQMAGKMLSTEFGGDELAGYISINATNFN